MPFEIVISFDYWYELLVAGGPVSIAWKLFKDGGWIVFVLLVVYLIWLIWLSWRQSIFDRQQEFVLLALDIPKDNIQSPKAVEHIFSQLAGTLSKGNLIDRFWKGRKQESFSFEIVSDGGYLQFYVYTNVVFRDLVEAAVYAQYPNAIITEVDDYTTFKKLRFPDLEYKMWGAEMKFIKPNAYPIKTYPFFEHTMSKELKDPMSGVLEILSRLQEGEKIWLQLVILPRNSSWADDGESIVKKLSGESFSGKRTLIDHIADLPVKTLSFINDAIFPTSASESSSSDKNDLGVMQRLTPGEISKITAVQEKIGKIGFDTVFRFNYIGKNEVFKKERGVKGVIGALQQFSTLDLNAIVPNKKKSTSIDYFMVKTREAMRNNSLFRKYIKRSMDGSKIVLNTEELASIFHFPVGEIKPTLLSTVEAKRVEPPESLPSAMNLPTKDFLEDNLESDDAEEDDFISILTSASEDKDEVDDGLPDSLIQTDIENKQVEQINQTKTVKQSNKNPKSPPDNLPTVF